MHTGSQQERFALRLSPPRFATVGGLDEGESVDGPRALALQGPGTIGDSVQEPEVIEPIVQDQAA